MVREQDERLYPAPYIGASYNLPVPLGLCWVSIVSSVFQHCMFNVKQGPVVGELGKKHTSSTLKDSERSLWRPWRHKLFNQVISKFQKEQTIIPQESLNSEASLGNLKTELFLPQASVIISSHFFSHPAP